MKRVVVIAALLLAACTQSGFSPALKQRILAQCSMMGAPPSECACALSGYEQHYSENEFLALENLPPAKMPPADVAFSLDLARRCQQR